MSPVQRFATLCTALVGLFIADGASAQVWSGAHAHDVHCVAFSPDGRILATGSLHNERTTPHRGDKSLPDDLPDRARKLVTSRGGEVKLWDVDSGREISTFRGHNDCICAVAFSPDGRTLATSNAILIGIEGRDKSCDVICWDVKSGKKRATLTGQADSVRSLAFSSYGSRLAACCYDGMVSIWDPRTAKRLQHFAVPGGKLWSLAFAPDGRTLAVGSHNGSVTFWDPRTARKQGDVQTIPGFNGCSSLAFSPDGKLLAGALLPAESTPKPEPGIVQVWEIATAGKANLQLTTLEKSKFTRHTNYVRSVAVSPDGGTAASAGADGTVRIWNSTTGAELAVLKEHTGVVDGVAFSPDGKRLASVGWDGSLKLWDTAAMLQKSRRSE